MSKHGKDEKQSERFIETAREIGADEDKSAADDLMIRLARTPPEPKPAHKPKAKKPAK
jgi:hypothetical protein